MESATKYFLVKASEYRPKKNNIPPTSAAEHRKLGIKNSFDRVQKTLSGDRRGDIYQATAEFRAKARAPLFQRQQPRVERRRPINPPRRVLPQIPHQLQPHQGDFEFDIRDLPLPQDVEHTIDQDSDSDTNPLLQDQPGAQFFTPNTPPVTPATPVAPASERRHAFGDSNEATPTRVTWNQERQRDTNVYNRLYNDRSRSTPTPQKRSHFRTKPTLPPRTVIARRAKNKRGGLSGAGYSTQRNAENITSWEARR